MNKSGASLLLLWSLWSTGGLGLGDTILNGDTLDRREEGNGGVGLVGFELPVIGRDEDGQEQRKRHQRERLPSSSTITPLISTTVQKDVGLQDRQADEDHETTKQRSESDEGGDIGGQELRKNPPSGPPKPPSDTGSSSSADPPTTSGIYVSTTSSASSTVSSTSGTGSTGEPPTTTGAGPPSTTGASNTASQTASTTGGDTTATAGAITEGTGAVSSIQESASRAIEEAKSSASSSAQSVVDAASASASANAAMASPPSQGSRLSTGAIVGLVVGVAIASSLLSALAVFLIMRRRAKRREAEAFQFPSDLLPPDSGDPGLAGDAYVHSFSHSRSYSADPLTPHTMYTATAPPPPFAGSGPSRAAAFSSQFTPEMKQQFAAAVPPMTSPISATVSKPIVAPAAVPTQNPHANSHAHSHLRTELQSEPPTAANTTAAAVAATGTSTSTPRATRPRTLSVPSDDGMDPVFPVSPLSTAGDGPYGSNRGGGGGSGPSRQPSVLTVDEASASAGVGAGAVGLARKQSINGGQKAQLVRVGSQKSIRRNGGGGGSGSGSGSGAASTHGEGGGETRLYSFTTDASGYTAQEGGVSQSSSLGADGGATYLQPRPLVKDRRYAVPSSLAPGAGLQAQGPGSRPVDPYAYNRDHTYY